MQKAAAGASGTASKADLTADSTSNLTAGSKTSSKTNSPLAPKMEVHQSWWAMRQIGEAHREWTMEEKLEHIYQAGYDGILGRLPIPEEAELWREKLDHYKLRFGIEAFITTRADIGVYLEQAAAFGVDYINAQVGHSFLIGSDAVALLEELLGEAAQYGIPLFVETHRGRVTQDLLRTIDYVRALHNLRLTIDLSHYVVAGEIYRNVEAVDPYFEPLLARTASIHGRISNGQQIQADITSLEDHPMTAHFRRWWTKGMAEWHALAKPGDFLPFVCELGPPDYAITAARSGRLGYGDPIGGVGKGGFSGELERGRQLGRDGQSGCNNPIRLDGQLERNGHPGRDDQHERVEISDRWTSSLSLKKLAKELWAETVGT